MTSQTDGQAEGRVWLSKQGGTDGPFSLKEIEQLKAKGEFYKYVYIWGTDDKSWRPLHPVPPPPALLESLNPEKVAREKSTPPTESPKPHAPAHAPVAAQPAVSKQVTAPGQQAIHALTAVCHDNRHIVGGTIQRVSATDGFMSSEDYFATIPPFNKGHWLWINLLDEANGKTENARAEVVQLTKSKTHWEYQLKWKSVPSIIRNLD